MHLKNLFRPGLARKVLIILFLPVVSQVVFVAILFDLLRQAERDVWKENHSKSIISLSNELSKNFYDASAVLLGYTYTRSSAMLERYQALLLAIPERIRLIELLVEGDPLQSQAIQQIRITSAALFSAVAQDLVSNSKAGQSEYLRNHKVAVNKMLQSMYEFVEHEKRTSNAAPLEQRRARQRVVDCLVVGLVANITLAIVLTVVFNRSTTSRLAVLMDNTERMAKGEALLPVTGGSDEIASLDRVFHEMAATIDQAARDKQELLEMVSHDLRSPLTSIQLFLESMSIGVMGDLPPVARQESVKAEETVTRLIGLVNDLLDVEKMEAGKLVLDKQRVHTDKVIGDAIHSIQTIADTHGISIVGPEEDFEVMADPGRLVQVLINLLSNAVKFSPDGSVIVVAVEDQPKSVEISVADQGSGIKREFLDKIFERFQQGNDIDNPRLKGSGLGLFICKVIVESHGGEIGVKNAPESGSIFWFRLPKL